MYDEEVEKMLEEELGHSGGGTLALSQSSGDFSVQTTQSGFAPSSSVSSPGGVAEPASPQGGTDEEIQVWISYQNQSEVDGTTQTTILRMMPNETIADVKLRVQARKGWFASQQKLTFGEMELEDAETIELVARAAGIYNDAGGEGVDSPPPSSPGGASKECNHVHLSVHLSDILNVRIKTLQGETTLAAQPQNTVREIKEAVSLMNGYLPDHQHFFMNGRLLTEDSKPLSEADDNLSRSPIVHVLVRRTTKVKILPNAGSEFELSISAVETVESLKRRIEAAEGIPALSHRVVHNGQYLPETASLADYGVDKESVLVLEPITRLPIEEISSPVSPLDSEGEGAEDSMATGDSGAGAGAGAAARKKVGNVDESLRHCVNMLKQAQAGFNMHMAPCLASAGTGGAYFLLGPRGNKVAVFKPEDEEPNAENNPRGLASPSPRSMMTMGGSRVQSNKSSNGSGSGPNGAAAPTEGLRKGTLPGEGAQREFAAYILDHGGLAQVPPTAMVCLKQTSNKKFASVDWNGTQGKRGSIQMFVPYESDCEEMGVSRFRKHEVHKIALLDIRLANTDRNGSNVLARRETDQCEWTLVPIDHGYCLPGSLSDICFDWIYWPQASQPFDEEMLEYIRALDVEEDLERLASNGVTLRPECELVFRVCNILLKVGVQHGLTAHDIGCIMCRQTLQQSILEKMSRHALKKLTKDRIQGTGKLQLHELDQDLGILYLQEVSRQIHLYIDEVFLKA